MLQGVTEALPVSSSTHLRLATRGLPPAEVTLLATALHLGSAVGTAWVLRRDLPVALRRPGPLVLATLPPVAVGGLAAGVVERRLGGPRATAAALAVGGLLLAAADCPLMSGRRYGGPRDSGPRDGGSRAGGPRDSGPRDSGPWDGAPRDSGLRDATAVGLAQAAALVPGVSRSGAALTVLRARGHDRATAVQQATLLGLPVTAGAVLRAAVRVDRGRLRASAAPLAAGAAAAAVTTAVTLPMAQRLLRSPAATPALAAYRVLVAWALTRAQRER